MTDTMRAALVERTGGPEAIRITDRPVPEPGPDEISIDVQYAGTGFVDTLFRSGAFELPLPLVPGIEVVGRIRAVGDGVDGFAPDEPVAALLNDFGRGPRAGGYAGVTVAHRSMVVPLPQDADPAAVCAVVVNGVTAWIALRELARAGVHDRVLVLGASGGLGATTARIAAVLPTAQVIGVVSGDASRAPTQCTDVVVGRDLAPLDDVTADGLVDVVIDPVGGAVRGQAFERLAPFGRHVILGNASGEDPSFGGDDIWQGTGTVTGLSLGGIAHLRPALITDALRAVVDLVSRGVLAEPAPHIVPLDQAAEVHRSLERGGGPAKTLLSL